MKHSVLLIASALAIGVTSACQPQARTDHVIGGTQRDGQQCELVKSVLESDYPVFLSDTLPIYHLNCPGASYSCFESEDADACLARNMRDEENRDSDSDGGYRPPRE